MDIIPVIDLLNGQVVHAQRGDREHYRPIVSKLSSNSDIGSIMSGMMELYPFKRLYIADIDAIQGRSPHHEMIASTRKAFPSVEIWLDAGIRSGAQAKDWQALQIRCVIGSENIHSLTQYDEIRTTLDNSFLLSLDFRNGHFLGTKALLSGQSIWPDDIIVMSLDRVGSQSGPDLDTLNMLNLSGKNLYAAGGCRDTHDLVRLAEMGISGVLLATMLHNGTLNADEIANHQISAL